MGKPKRILAGSVIALAAGGFIAGVTATSALAASNGSIASAHSVAFQRAVTPQLKCERGPDGQIYCYGQGPSTDVSNFTMIEL